MSFTSGKLGSADLKPEVSASSTSLLNGQENTTDSQNKACQFTKIVINQSIIHALVDSGSASTIISKDTFKRLNLDTNITTNESTKLTAANGSEVSVLGRVSLDFELDNENFSYQFLIAEFDDIDCILGSDFLEEFDVAIKFGKGIMQIGKHKIKLQRQSKSRVCRIKLSETITLPPNSEVITGGHFDGQTTKSDFVLEPLKHLSQKGILICRALVNTDRNEIPLSLLNVTDSKLKVKKGTFVGNVRKADIITEVLPKQSSSPDNFPEHLQPLLDEASTNLNPKETEKLKNLLTDFQDVFADKSGTISQTNYAEHTIDVGDTKPIKLAPRRVPIAQKEIVKNEIKKMLDQNIIEPSNSPWSSPIVLVTKPDNTIRFCIDYRKLNAVTKKDAYPLPRIAEALDTLSSEKYFCTLDLASGYWQIPMAKEHKHYTAFNSHLGFFQFRVMPFGLTNAPATFERLIEKVLFGLQWEKCLCYLDDIIVFGETFDKTLENLKLVLNRFREANLTVKPKKCHLFQKSIEYLGHNISEEGISCSKNKVDAVLNWPVPNSKTELRSFLGLINYYRKYIKDLATITYPLTRLTQKNKPFIWSEECQISFDKMKELLVSAPILGYPQQDGQFILDTDGSQFGIGAVLSQVQNGTERVIAYASKSLNKAQQRYCTTFIELLAVVTFIRHFRHYLWGQHFIVRTDHASLTWLRNFKDPEGMIARWLTVLETYNFTIQHRKGSNHGNADAMSRIPRRKCKRTDCPDCGICCNCSSVSEPPVEEISVFTINDSGDTQVTQSNWIDKWTVDDLKELQRDDLVTSKLLDLKSQFINKPSPSRTGGRIRRLPSCRVVKPHQWTRLFAVGGDS